MTQDIYRGHKNGEIGNSAARQHRTGAALLFNSFSVKQNMEEHRMSESIHFQNLAISHSVLDKNGLSFMQCQQAIYCHIIPFKNY